MRCAKLRNIIVVVPAEQRSERLQRSVEQHLRQCPECARYARQMAALADSLRALPASQVPEDFTAMVKSRVQARRRKPKVAWLARVFGVERAAAPAISPRLAWGTASALAIVLAVGLFVGTPRGTVGPPTNGAVIAHNGTAGEVTLPVMDEMELWHRRYSESFAVTDDPGMNLVSYSPDEW